MTGGSLRLQGILVILGAVLIGMAGGVWIERVRSDTPEQAARSDARRPFRGNRPERRPGGVFPRMFEDLDLTAEQRSRIDSVFRAWQPRTDSVMNDLLPRIEALRDSVRMEVDAVLTPEQRERLREISPPFPRDGRNQFRRRPGGGNGRPPPPPPDR